ncbi:hypothetical protein SDRG_01472 [Saprolegnia diclina VS20]|uniref:FYVE-type domain-containing protein n=1 Tax=Saprolegnia diclina (strain VS20) TaxID=1156394 RepID=T0R576_SAPDV|nr:hypothetical protein SDRG_01472 [Saprolegnia diclina VS20]EQC41505.1 hypothetical protein SDRG_01472 [Saprolegnia diclina VS20]|eukprot:XP_008605219.1 hypothetical protein SDRG_01472 [Saprolegnia diclina VS20]
MSAMTLPLRPDYFKCPPLMRCEKDQLIALGQKICKDVVLNAMSMQLAPVDAVLTNPKTRRRARMRRGTDVFNRQLDGMCAYTQIPSTLAQVADFFYLDTNTKLRAYASVVGQTILDRQTLYTLVDHPGLTTQRNQLMALSPLHYIGVEWMVMECPFGVSNRDTCFLEAHDEFEFYDERAKVPRRGFVRAVHSIDMACCPPLRETHGLVRSSLVRSGHIFIETDDPNVLDYVCVYVTNPNGKVPRSVNLKMLHHQCARVLNLEEFFHLERITSALDHGEFAPVGSFQNKAIANFCACCDKKFGLFYRKSHCRKCGHVVCHQCSRKWPIQFRKTSTVTLRLCHVCFVGSAGAKPLPTSSALTGLGDQQGTGTCVMSDDVSILSSSVSAPSDVLCGQSSDTNNELEQGDYFDDHPAMEGMFSFHSSCRSLHFSKSSFSPYGEDSNLGISM